VESSIGFPRERAEITVQADGFVDVVIGTQPSGQGHETSFAQVVADLLGIAVENVNIIMGDTDIVSVGGGSHSGRSMRHAGTVISKAAQRLISNGKHIAAFLLEANPDEVDFAEGRFTTPRTNRSFGLLELAREAAQRDLPDALKSGLSGAADHEMHDPVFPNGCAVCECEIDPDTGEVAIARYTAVDDVGRCINPMIVDGQTHGGIAQGLGQAVSECCYLDGASGQPLCGSLLDYGIPRADQLPAFTTRIIEVLSPTNPLGIKAGGEGGTTPAPAAMIGAIVHALDQFGIRDIRMPATSAAIWEAIETAKAAPVARESVPTASSVASQRSNKPSV